VKADGGGVEVYLRALWCQMKVSIHRLVFPLHPWRNNSWHIFGYIAGCHRTNMDVLEEEKNNLLLLTGIRCWCLCCTNHSLVITLTELAQFPLLYLVAEMCFFKISTLVCSGLALLQISRLGLPYINSLSVCISAPEVLNYEPISLATDMW
jgi:hypothetical protein